jgi:hypothetical protein
MCFNSRSLFYKTSALLLALLVFHGTKATAATIDQFQVQASISSPETVGVSSTIHTPNSKALGGGRSLTAMKTSAGTGVGVTRIETTSAGEILGITQGDHGGFASVVWDGDSQPDTLKANGLGSLDLTQDDANAFLLQLRSFDFAYSKKMLITIRIYDPAFPLGNKFSQVEITIDRVVDPDSPITLTVPFSLFATAGNSNVSGFSSNTSLIGGGATASNIGALALEFRGYAGDLTAGLFSTNGRCSAVPNSNGTVLDECGVCLDDTANANKGKDACGICYKGPPGYDYDSTKVFDACGLCPSHPQYSYPLGNKDQCGLCPTEPNWGNSKDPCGVCFGDGTSCADCSGTPNGSAKFDQCNVCGGDGTTCLDCLGVPFGSAKIDQCGVCAGDSSSCKDCAGVIKGSSTVDVCGVCGGLATDGSRCGIGALQCKTVPATDDVKKFDARLVVKARQLRARYIAERTRSKRTGCKIPTKDSELAVAAAFRHILTRSNEIFSAGVEVCGDSCITTSYATQVEALKPEFKILEQNAVNMANKVNSCYTKLGVPRNSQGGGRGVANTVNLVSRGLNNLIEECRKKRVCPPGSGSAS